MKEPDTSWGIFIHVHVSPIGDKREHVLSPDCWCKPDGEWMDKGDGYYLMTHHALDKREKREHLREVPKT